MGRPQLVSALLAVVVALAPAIARAQSAEDKAAAESAFEEGKRLMMAKAFAEACPKFAESLRRDPGIGTMLGLADCYEKNGQSASAWAEFREAAGLAARKGDKREAVARANAARLEPLLSRVIVRVPVDADVRGLVLKRDGLEIGRALWGAEVPVDPGVHAIAATAPGWKEWQITVDVPGKPGTRTVTVPRLEAAPEPPPIGAPATTPLAPSAPEGDPGRTQKIAAIAAGGAGLIGVVVGTIFGLQAKSKLADSNANNHCGVAGDCDQVGLGLRSDAKSAALVSTVGFVIGGAAIAGGAVLWLTAPRRDDAAPRVGVAPSARGLVLVGSW